jgi:hypothetical protein
MSTPPSILLSYLFAPPTTPAATAALNAHCSGPVMWSDLQCVSGHPDTL